MKIGKSFMLFSIVMISLLLFTACSDGKTAPTVTNPPTSQPVATQPSPPQTTRPSTVVAPNDIRDTTGKKIEYLDAVPMTKLITAKKNAVRTTKPVKVPLIQWGGDVATIYANGNSRVTQPGSIFAQKGLSIELFREDNFLVAVEKVVSGETPYLRGTLDMINSASEALKDRGIEMVVIYQETWSTGGDTLVVRSDRIKTQNPAELRGKTIGIQRYGPHMLFLAALLKDAELTLNDVKIKWMRELAYPPYYHGDKKEIAVDPMSAMQLDSDLDAVLVISPDMVALTSGGAGFVGIGGEGSVQGAKLFISSKTFGTAIADIYAVRKDYFDANSQEVQNFMHGLLLGQEATVDLFNNRATRQAEYQSLLKVSAEILRDNPQGTADIEGLLMDCTFVGFRGNVQFFTGEGTLRTFDALNHEAQDALMAYGLLTKKVPLAQANWDYNVFMPGLRDTAGVMVQKPKFDQGKVEQFVARQEASGKADEGKLFTFLVFFSPNQSDFPAEKYSDKFDEALRRLFTYNGSLLVIKGHADPAAYLNAKDVGASEAKLQEIVQAAKNVSAQRALAIRASFIAYAKSRGLEIEPSQVTIASAGIADPAVQNRKDTSRQAGSQWIGRQENMRAEFRFMQVEAESEIFESASGGK